jgi:hypothetical protein
MDRKKITFFAVGILISTAVALFIFRESKTPATKSFFAKAELGSKDDPFARIEYERKMLADPLTGKIPDNIRAKELSFAKNLPTVESVSLNKQTVATWSKRGPINRGGRTRALGIDVRTQTAPNITILAGGVSGGIYKSTDNGASWVNKLSPSLIHSVSCIAQDTRSGQENTWYAGTGEAQGTDFNGGTLLWGDGVFKSTDNGDTWSLIPSTSNRSVQTLSQFKFVNNIAINKSTGSVFAAACNVVLRSQDGGTSWNVVRSTVSDNTMSDVQITSTGIIYAAVPDGNQDAGISRSTDDGANWTDITPGGFTNYQRIVMAIAPSNENILYVWAFTGAGATKTELWKYDVSSTNWANLTPNLPPPGQNVDGIDVQFSYDMVIKVKPDDENFVVIGGTNLYRSTDGFSTPVTSSGWIGGYSTANDISSYANHHPDQHSMVFLNPPNSNTLYSGHDGGISRTNDATSTVTWTDLGRGYITSQFFTVAIDPVTSNDKVIAGGMQDNGCYSTFSDDFNTDWVDWQRGGDGGYAEVRKTSSTDYTIYLESQNGFIERQKYSNGVLTASVGIKPNYATSYAFVNPFVLDVNNSDIMYFAAGDSVARSTDVSTANNWTIMGNATTGSSISTLAVSKTPANRLYVGGSSGEVLRIDGANTGDPMATNISAGLPKGFVNCIYVDPANADNVIVVFSNYNIISLWSSTNGGTNWTNISGNLEENPDGSGNGPSCRSVTSVFVNGVMTYFVGTSTGLWSTTNLNGNSTIWAKEGSNSIGNVVCTMVKGRNADGYVVVGTHGSGVYSASLVTAVDDERSGPYKYLLSQNYPNPFNPSTTISFTLPQSGNVNLTIFDAAGREIEEIANKEFSAGTHSINYNAGNLSSGVYLYRITSGTFTQVNKMMLLK